MKEPEKLNEESLIKVLNEMREDKRVLLSIKPTKIIYHHCDMSPEQIIRLTEAPDE